MAEIITSEIEIQSGVISSGLTVDTGGVVTVLSGGIVTDAEAVNYGWFWVEEGGHINNIHLTHSGDAMVDGGSAENLTMESAGQVDIFAGTLRNGTIRDKGFGVIYTGGSAFDVSVSAGGRYLINGGYAENTVVSSGGSFTVQLNSGLADKTTIEAGGHARITSDGQMWETILNGGRLDVISGRILATTLNAGELHVSSGGPESGSGCAETTVVNAGSFIVSGATATDTTLNGGEFIVSGGSAQKTTVNGGDFIASDAEVQSTTVSGGAVQFIGGTADKTDIFSGSVLVSGGTVQNTTLGSSTGGSINIPIIGPTFTPFDPDGPIILNPINWDDIILVADGGTATITYGTGGSILLDGGATTVYTPEQRETIGYAGYPGQTVNGDEASAGAEDPSCRLDILNGGLAVSTTVNSGLMRIFEGGTANETTVKGGTFHVSSGGIANNITMSSGGGGGSFIVGGDTNTYGAGISFNPVYRGGTPFVTVFEGGAANTVTVSGGLLTLDGGTASNTTINGGTMHVRNNGTAFVTSLGGGYLLVDNGTLNSTTIARGTVSILNGGRTEDTTIHAGELHISSGGTANETMISRGTIRISSGGVASAMTMNGGETRIESGGVISGIEVNSGAKLRISSDGVLTGNMVFASGADIEFESGGMLAFDVSGMVPGAATILSDLAGFKGTPVYALTVSDSQAEGIYTLCAEATGFRDTITVRSQLGEILGTLTVGNAVLINNQYYTVRVIDNVLNLTVSAEAPVPLNAPTTVYVNSNWAELEAGTVVRVGDGLSATIGIDAFATGRDATNAVAGTGTIYVTGGDVSFEYGISRDTVVLDGAAVSRSSVVHNGTLTLNEGSSERDITVEDGTVSVNAGATMQDVTIIGGTVMVKAGGILRNITVLAYESKITIEEGGTLTGTGSLPVNKAGITINGTLDFDISKLTECSTPLFNDLIFDGTPNLVITVDDDQARGSYILASVPWYSKLINAAFTVVNKAGESLGTISVGGTIAVNGKLYTLDYENEDLSPKLLILSVSGDGDDIVGIETAYVNSEWSKLETGTVVEVPGTTAVIGTDAFAGITQAKSMLLGNGTIVVTGGSYTNQSITRRVDFLKGTLTKSSIRVNGILNFAGTGIELNVKDGCILSMLSGSTGDAIDVTDNGVLIVNEGASVRLKGVGNGGSVTVKNGGVITKGDLYGTSMITVENGGFCQNIKIDGGTLILNEGAKAKDITTVSRSTLIVDEGAMLTYSIGESEAFNNNSTIIVNGTFEFDISDVVSTLQTEDIKFSGLDFIYGRPQYVFVDDSDSLPQSTGTSPGGGTYTSDLASNLYYTLPIGIDQLLNLDKTLSIKRNGIVYKIKNNGYVISTSPSEAVPKGTTTAQGLALFSGMAYINSRYYKINILNAENGSGICMTLTVGRISTRDVYLNSDWANKYYNDVVQLVGGGTARYFDNAFDDVNDALEVCKGHRLTIESGTYSFSEGLQVSSVAVKDKAVIRDSVLNCDIILESGATGTDLTVKGLEVKDGAVCRNITVVSRGTLTIQSGGVLTGTGSFASDADITINGTLVFDIAGLTPADQPLYSGLKYIKGTPTFTLSVSSAQECGLYVLASETGGFGDTISVTDESGVSAGTLVIGNTVRIGDRYYTLRTMNDRLTLSVSTEELDSLPAVVTVNAAWAGYEAGQPVILEDGSTAYIGYNASADLNTAYDYLSADGVVIVVGGTFTPVNGIIRKTVAGNGVLIVNATVEKNGCLTVGNGATAESITVLGGTLSLNEGGVMAGTITVNAGGLLVLEKNVVQNGSISLAGGTLCLAGYELSELVTPEGVPNTGDITGTGKFKAGANIRINHLFFDLSGRAPDASPLFEGISAVMKDRDVGNGFLNILVVDDQSAGTYYLATDAADTQTVRVKCHDEVLVWNLGISDGPVRVGDRSYRLTLTESNDLYLTIRDYEPLDTVYINTAWADLAAEEIVMLVSGGTAVIGVDAFATIDEGRKVLQENGTIVLDGGVFISPYQSDISISNETVVAMSGSTVYVTVESGGTLTLESGAVCKHVKVRDKGSLLIKAGAELNLTGDAYNAPAAFEEGASVTIDGTVNFLFDTNSGYKNLSIDGYSRIQGAPTYRVLLQGPLQLAPSGAGIKQVEARLFYNVSGFTDSIAIMDADGVELGTVSLDSYVRIDDEYYAFLSYNGLYVNLTIANYLSLHEVHFSSDWVGLEDGTDVELVDGSTVTVGINAFSDLETAFGKAEKTILIDGGTAYFSPDATFLNTAKEFVANEDTVLSGLLQVYYDQQIYSFQPQFFLTMKQGSVLKDATVQTGVVTMEDGSGMEGSVSIENSTVTVVNGRISIGADADVTFVNSTISITITGMSPGENAVIEDASRIKGTPIYLCVLGRDDQTLGSYRIAGDAGGIESITLKYENDYSSGIVLSVSDLLGITMDGRTYKLSLDENNDLFLTISDYVVPETIYIGTEWNGLDRGTVVEVPGGTAVIGADAFSDMQSASSIITVDTELVFVSGSYSFLKSYTKRIVMADYAVIYDSTLTAGSTAILKQNAKAFNVVISEQSALVLEDGTETRDLSVLGSLSVGDNASAGNLQVYAGGTLTVEAGAKLTGWAVFEEGANITVDGTLDFDISAKTASLSYLYSNFASVQGTPNFTLTVRDFQSLGIYALATGVTEFNSTITVVNSAGTQLGRLSLGTTTRIGDKAYRLTLNDGILSVALLTPEKNRKCDVDGNGISDVLFQYTGGDNQTGYWLNGKDEWRSSNCAHPVEWTLLGAYDMDSDGIADSVFVGNGVEVDGVKGAYIGYYKSGVDTDNNWVNIHFLENEEENVWLNKIGNLTGNPDKNSIVWHCAGLGALGVWTDGTSEWTSLGAGFDSNWTMVGCGDFNGDGRDSVVMSYLGGVKYYAIGLDGSAVDMGSLNWGGWEVRAIGDFAGDGKDDMILFHKEYGAVVMIADGNLDNYTAIGQLDAKDWFIVGAGDYDGDRKDDLLVRQYSTGMLGYYSACDTSKWVEMGRGVDMDWTVIA